MAKVLNSTVHIYDPETGQVDVWKPGKKLSAAEAKQLNWPKDHESWDEVLDEDMSQEEAVDSGHPMADRVPDEGPQADEALEILQEARDAERAEAQDAAGVPEKERTGRGVPRK